MPIRCLFLSFLGIFTFHALNAQKKHSLRWVFPLQKGVAASGKPSDGFAAVEGNNGLLLIASDGTSKPLPYDSTAYGFGPCWYVWKNGLTGIYHLDEGEWIPPVYHDVQPVEKKAGNWAFSVLKYGMEAVVDSHNNLMLPYQKNGYARMSYVRDSILSYLKHDLYNPSAGNFLFLSRSGRKVPFEEVKMSLPVDFQRISANAYVLTNSKNGVMHSDTFTAAEKFVDDVAVVKRKDLWGFVRRDGSWVIEPRFQAAQPFDTEGHAVVKDGGKYGVVQRDGAYLIQPQFEFLKPMANGLYEFKENGKIGLVNKMGSTVLPSGAYGGFQPAGTDGFAVKSGDSLVVFRLDGTPLRVGRVSEVSRERFGETFVVKQNLAWVAVRGLLSSDGSWRIPAVFKGRVTDGRYFLLAEAVTEPCCMVGSFNLGANQPGKFLVYTRNGELLVPEPLDILPFKPDSPFIIYKKNKKYGLIAHENLHIPAEYDGIKALGNGWFEMRKDGSVGLLKYEE